MDKDAIAPLYNEEGVLVTGGSPSYNNSQRMPSRRKIPINKKKFYDLPCTPCFENLLTKKPNTFLTSGPAINNCQHIAIGKLTTVV